MNILVIGSGGREHCLAWKISKSPLVDKIYAAPGNAGIAGIAECIKIDIPRENFEEIANLVREKDIDLTVVGPEAPLVEGIVDYFNKEGLKVFGPDSKAAMIEGSKVFAKEFMQRNNIPVPGGIVLGKKDYDRAKDYIKERKKYPVVIKADGLAAGKGVVIAMDKNQAMEALEDCFIKNKFGTAGNRVIIEDFLDGYELSVLSLCDGKNIIPMAPAQDYKRIFDNDRGKNTGGMGSYSPVPRVDDKTYGRILDEIVFPTYNAMIREGIIYKGVLYAGIMISNGDPYLLEYNCRFGDPETQVILPRLKDDIVPLLTGCAEGNLKNKEVRWDSNKCVCVVAASEGYPRSSSKGDVISGLENYNSDKDIIIFHAGTKVEDGSIVTNGGRVFGVVSRAASFSETREKIYSAIGKIKFRGIQYRKDIALKAERSE
ncbi:MAG: phosphoribosylamine--glycine ligase [Actinomycetota bacterium]|nr:phosphoribosylamine--glycine ligase [Actinomycetota bacterium]